MIPRKYRFHRRNAVNYVHKAGQSVRGSAMSVRYVTNNKEHCRFAVVVSKKTAKSAVTRNRIRRRTFAAIQPHLGRTASHSDVVIMVYDASVVDMLFSNASKELELLLQKAGIIAGDE